MAKLILGEVLKRKKLSKRQFAKRMGYHYASVFQFFRPTYNPTFKMMIRWAEAAECKVRDLFKE